MAIQQGDVRLVKVDSFPPDARAIPPKEGRFVLAEGEATGHKHAIEDIGGIRMVEKDGFFYLHNDRQVVIRHEEHGPVELPSGIWKVKRIREYDHFLEESRSVMD